jgi:hypothetical protein
MQARIIPESEPGGDHLEGTSLVTTGHLAHHTDSPDHARRHGMQRRVDHEERQTRGRRRGCGRRHLLRLFRQMLRRSRPGSGSQVRTPARTTAKDNPWPCPWCDITQGYRSLTVSEEVRRIPINIAHSAISGAFNLVRHPGLFIAALLTPTGDFRCNVCHQVVRICPKCDFPVRWINSAAMACAECGTAFM